MAGGIDSFTKIYLAGGESDGSTTIVDSSSAPHTMTCVNQAQADTAQAKFTSSSILFDGTTDAVTTPDSDDWALGTGDFTIDFWYRPADITAVQAFTSQQQDASNIISFYKGTSGNQRLNFNASIGGVNVADYQTSDVVAISNGNWYHVAVARSGSTLYMFLDGVSLPLDVFTAVGNLGNITGDLRIGSYGTSNLFSINGHLAGYRYSKGIARWTADFTPPSGVYTLSVPVPVMQNSYRRRRQ